MSQVPPDPEAMRRHLEHLAHGAGRIELAWRDPVTGKYDRAQLFDITPEGRDALITLAIKTNRIPGSNVAIGVAARADSAWQGKRNGAKQVSHSCCFWADIDDADAVRNLKLTCSLLPTFFVVTSRTPHLRLHCYWCVDDPIGNLDYLQAVNKAIVARVGGDPKSADPSHLLRLAGSIGWPVKPGRIVEPVTFHTPADPDVPSAYAVDEVVAAFPPPPRAARARTTPNDIDDWAAQIIEHGVDEGERNGSLTRLCGYLLRRLDPYVTRAILNRANEACHPPLPEAEVMAIWDSICSREVARRAAA